MRILDCCHSNFWVYILHPKAYILIHQDQTVPGSEGQLLVSLDHKVPCSNTQLLVPSHEEAIQGSKGSLCIASHMTSLEGPLSST